MQWTSVECCNNATRTFRDQLTGHTSDVVHAWPTPEPWEANRRLRDSVKFRRESAEVASPVKECKVSKFWGAATAKKWSERCSQVCIAPSRVAFWLVNRPSYKCGLLRRLGPQPRHKCVDRCKSRSCRRTVTTQFPKMFHACNKLLSCSENTYTCRCLLKYVDKFTYIVLRFPTWSLKYSQTYIMLTLAAWFSGIVSACHRGDWSYIWVVRSNPARVYVGWLLKKL
jgi:hypothetical protein